MTPEVWASIGLLAFTALGFFLRGYVSKPDALKREIMEFKQLTQTSITELRGVVDAHIKRCDAIPIESIITKLGDFREAFNAHVLDDRAFYSDYRAEHKKVESQWDTLGRSLAVIEERVSKNGTDADHVRHSLHELRETMAGIVGRLEVMKLGKFLPTDLK